MSPLFDYIYEADTTSKDFAKHNYKYLKTFLKTIILEPEKIKIGKQGEDEVNIDHDAAVEFVRNICRVSEDVDLENVDVIERVINNACFDNLSIEEFNNTLKEHKVSSKLNKWNGLWKESVKEGNFEPSAGDLEYLVAYTINKHTTFDGEYAKYNEYKDDPVKSMAVVMKIDPDNIKKEDKVKINRLLAFYNQPNNKSKIDESAKALKQSIGDIHSPLVKLPNNKKDKKSSWKSRDNTPKTDICTLDPKENINISLKKYPSSQLMSGSKKETMSTLKVALNRADLDEKEKKDLQYSIDLLNELDWDKGNSDKVTQELRKLFENEKVGRQIIYIAATGEGKFKKGTRSISNKLVTFDFYHPEHCSCHDIDDFVDATYKALKDRGFKDIVANQKSSNGKPYTACRVGLKTDEIEKHLHSSEQSKEETSKEEIVKDKKGVEWIKRKKENGEGTTYCRKDDRKTTMSQKEYNKKNHIKENYNMNLKDFIIYQINH